MNFNKTIQALVNYDSVYVTAVKAWREARDSIIKDFAGENKANRLADAKTLLDNTLAKAKADTLEAVKANFEAARAAVNAVVTKPVPADFSGDIEAIKTRGDMLTFEEINIYMDKYKDSYTATRALARIAIGRGFQGVRYMVVSVDKVLELMRETEAFVLNEIQNKNSVALSYYYRILISNVEQNTLLVLSDALTRLENGDFSDFEVFPMTNLPKREAAEDENKPLNRVIDADKKKTNGIGFAKLNKNDDSGEDDPKQQGDGDNAGDNGNDGQQNGDDNQQGGNEGLTTSDSIRV